MTAERPPRIPAGTDGLGVMERTNVDRIVWALGYTGCSVQKGYTDAAKVYAAVAERLFDDPEATATLRGVVEAMGTQAGWKVDVVLSDLSHRYWSTHCRHDRHDACAATELAPGVPRQPSQCKTCSAPCICPCGHKEAQS